MPYPFDLVGKVIQFSRPKNRLTGPNTNLTLTGHAPDLSVRVFNYIPGHPGVGGAPPRPPLFVDTDIPWNISFLEYHPGEVTTVRLQRPVLTGPMSGCFLFRYFIGGFRIAHVGTHDAGPDAPLSVRARGNWKAFITQQGATDIMGATPIDYFSEDEIKVHKVGKMAGVPQIYGLFEPAGGNSYAALLAPIGVDITSMTNMFRFSALKQMYLQPWSSIRAMRIFR